MSQVNKARAVLSRTSEATLVPALMTEPWNSKSPVAVPVPAKSTPYPAMESSAPAKFSRTRPPTTASLSSSPRSSKVEATEVPAPSPTARSPLIPTDAMKGVTEALGAPQAVRVINAVAAIEE